MINGTTQILFGGMGRLTENSILSIKNKSYAITADVDVPQAGAEGVIVAQGGSTNGWSLYAKGGKLKYCYNFFGIDLTFVEAKRPTPAGHHQVRMEFQYDGDGLGKGGDIALYMDGKQVGQGRVERTVNRRGRNPPGAACGKHPVGQLEVRAGRRLAVHAGLQGGGAGAQLPILDTLIELTQQMVEGELLQMEKLGQLISLDEHFNLIYRKTACLFSVCMRMGAILGGASAEQEESLSQYGRNLGMAFQIVDDVLDLTASENILGKPVASDLREGKVTMAVIHALQRCTPAEHRVIETVVQDRVFGSETHAQVLAILNRHGSLEAAYEKAIQYADLARNAICSFPDTEIKRALLWAPEFVVAREK